LASSDGEGLMALVKKILEAKDEANKMTRRVAKATAKMNDAFQEAERLGAHFGQQEKESESSDSQEQEKDQKDPELHRSGETENGIGTQK